MKVTFVYPDLMEGANWPGYYYSGLGILSAVLRQAGHPTFLLHITRRLRREEFLEALQPHLPGDGIKLIEFSLTANMVPAAKEWTAWLKEIYPDCLVIYGGVHPTLSPVATIALPGVDAICIGEGEGALLELCQHLEEGRDFSDIRNLWLKRNGQVMRNPLRPLVADLGLLPFPDRSLYDYTTLYNERQGYATMMICRGCPL